jgi:hypothetical protein
VKVRVLSWAPFALAPDIVAIRIAFRLGVICRARGRTAA